MSAKLLNVYARFVFTVIFNILLSVSALVDGLMLILRPQCPFGGLVSFILCTKGIQSYWWVCFTITKRCPGSLLPAFYSCRILTKNVSEGFIPFSLMVFLWYLSLLLFCRWGYSYIDAIEEFCQYCYQGFYYQLKFSHSDFAKFRMRQLWLLYIIN